MISYKGVCGDSYVGTKKNMQKSFVLGIFKHIVFITSLEDKLADYII